MTGNRKNVQFFSCLSPAINAWKQDPTIWKIVVSTKNGNERFIVKKKQHIWDPISEGTLTGLSESYARATFNEIFFVKQKYGLNSDELTKLRNSVSDEDFYKHEFASRIEGVYTLTEFSNLFKTEE